MRKKKLFFSCLDSLKIPTFALELNINAMYYVQIYKSNYWISVLRFMCKSIAYYYSDLIHKADNCLTKVEYFYSLN